MRQMRFPYGTGGSRRARAHRQAWEQWHEDHKRQRVLVEFTDLWVETMESMLGQGVSVRNIAEDAMHAAQDTVRGRVRDEHVREAVDILGKCWLHGPKLLEWARDEGLR